MSNIPTKIAESVFKLEKFLGLNENPSGDVKLKFGEATRCQNWKVTRDLNLQKRPGAKTLIDTMSKAPVQGLWIGNVKGHEIGLAASGNIMWLFYRDGEMLTVPEMLGELSTENRVSFFAYSNIVYILNGEEYYCYDIVSFRKVIGYRPLIITARTPTGDQNTMLESVNKLNGLRRVRFSPSGHDATFQLPETDLMSIDYVIDTTNGGYVDPNYYEVDRFAGTVKFLMAGEETITIVDQQLEYDLANKNLDSITAVTGCEMTDFTVDKVAARVAFTIETLPTAGTEVTFTECLAPESGIPNQYEIGYSAVSTSRPDVCRMTNAELFLGAQDNAVILYGDGTNKAVYSSIDYDGQPRADYFPDLNEIAVADANTPITGMIRHYSQLICFKSSSVYTIHYGLVTTATGNQEYAFYVTPINKEIGNAALGQVRLVLNTPYALNGHDLYAWTSNSRYSAALSIDERNAKRISDRIYATLGSFDIPNCYCYDDNYNQEYYICCGNEQLVYNYPADAWYYYTGLNIHSMCNLDEKPLFGTEDGRICELSEEHLNDDGNVIDCVWESGSMDFGKSFIRKFMSELWITMKPQAHSKISITVQTDKKSAFNEKEVERSLATFEHMDFSDFTFATNRKPQAKKIKLKAKKFAFLKIILLSKDLYTSAIVLAVDTKIRETGYVK